MADPSSVLGCWKITGVEPMPCGGSSLGGQNSPQDLTAATARGLAADMEIASLQVGFIINLNFERSKSVGL